MVEEVMIQAAARADAAYAGRTFDALGAADKERFTKRAKIMLEAALAASPNPDADDGRPCNMDVFAAALFEDCEDHFDRADAIDEWLHGDWSAALSYLEEGTIARIAPGFDCSVGGEA
jgi:hypothetical protein